ncbi:putative homeobox KN domain-containing protein [Helianthus anomalus]
MLKWYPSDADKHLLSRQTGLSRNQENNVHMSVFIVAELSFSLNKPQQ